MAPSFTRPLHQPGVDIPVDTDEMFFVPHLLSHGASWRTFDFLGYHHRMVDSFSKPGFRFMARWPSARATQAARRRINELTDRRLLMLPIEEVIGNLNRFLIGWGGYFRWGNSTRQFDKIDRHAINRVACLLAERHRRRRRLVHGRAILFAHRPDLMPRRLSGTVRYYRSAHATR